MEEILYVYSLGFIGYLVLIKDSGKIKAGYGLNAARFKTAIK